VARPRTLTLIMAGGAGGRLELLTKGRAKPAVPYAGVYRLIDFPLSNCLHSGFSDVWVIEQYNPASLADHLSNGRPWDLDRTQGGLLVLHPYLGEGPGGFHKGTADALWRNSGLIREFAPDALVVLSADAVYKLDYGPVVEQHLEEEADVTMVTTRVAQEDAGRYGVVQVNADGAITGYAYKPDEPNGNLITNEVFVFRPRTTLEALDGIAAESESEDGGGLTDFGDELLPRLVKQGSAREYPLDGYWRDVGTVASYWESHMDLLDEEPRFELDDPDWPILTYAGQRPPARIFSPAFVDRSMISPGAVVRGRVERSVLAPGVVVETGATVRDAVLLHGVVVRAGTTVEQAVLDAASEIGPGARVGEAGATRDGAPAITVVGAHERIAGGSRVVAGARVPSEDEG
jgi:glucose-1-phosphate adenylyltransferase